MISIQAWVINGLGSPLMEAQAMDAAIDCIESHSPQEPSVWSRWETASVMTQFKGLDSPWTSPRCIAAQLNVPARTLMRPRH